MEKKNKFFINRETDTKYLYRGIYVDYLLALSYSIKTGEIISFPNFFSTSKNRKIAEMFSNINSLIDKRTNFKFSIVMKIHVQRGINAGGIDIEDISIKKDEEEVLFPPFSFFKLINHRIIYDRYILELELEPIPKQSILLKRGERLAYNRINNFILIRNTSNDLNNFKNRYCDYCNIY